MSFQCSKQYKLYVLLINLGRLKELARDALISNKYTPTI